MCPRSYPRTASFSAPRFVCRTAGGTAGGRASAVPSRRGLARFWHGSGTQMTANVASVLGQAEGGATGGRRAVCRCCYFFSTKSPTISMFFGNVSLSPRNQQHFFGRKEGRSPFFSRKATNVTGSENHTFYRGKSTILLVDVSLSHNNYPFKIINHSTTTQPTNNHKDNHNNHNHNHNHNHNNQVCVIVFFLHVSP